MPDSRTPRRFITAMTATTTTAISVTCEFSAGEGRGQVGHARGHRHRHGQRVVDHQRAGHGHADPRPEVGGGDLVVAAAGRVGVHVLPVGGDHDQHQQADGERDPRRVADERQAARRPARAGSPGWRRPPTRARRWRIPAARSAWAAAYGQAARSASACRPAAAWRFHKAPARAHARPATSRNARVRPGNDRPGAAAAADLVVIVTAGTVATEVGPSVGLTCANDAIDQLG